MNESTTSVCRGAVEAVADDVAAALEPAVPVLAGLTVPTIEILWFAWGVRLSDGFVVRLNVCFEALEPDVPTVFRAVLGEVLEVVDVLDVVEGISALSSIHVPAVAPGFRQPVQVTFVSGVPLVDGIVCPAGCWIEGCAGVEGC